MNDSMRHDLACPWLDDLLIINIIWPKATKRCIHPSSFRPNIGRSSCATPIYLPKGALLNELEVPDGFLRAGCLLTYGGTDKVCSVCVCVCVALVFGLFNSSVLGLLAPGIVNNVARLSHRVPGTPDDYE